MLEYKVTLRAARVNANLSRSQAAEQMGVSPSTIKNWELGITSPDVQMLPKICALYGVPYDMINFFSL